MNKRKITSLRQIGTVLGLILIFTACQEPLEKEIQLQEPESAKGGGFLLNGFQGFAYERLSDGSIGSKIPNVNLLFTKEDSSASFSTTTNSAGYYKITLPIGRYYVLATHDDYEIYNSSPGFFVVRFASGYSTGNFFLTELTYGWQGVTYQRNADGSIGPTLSSVKLTFMKSDSLYSKVVYSSSSGYYKVSLPEGSYYAKAEKLGYWTYATYPGVSIVTAAGGYGTYNFFQRKLPFIPFP